MNDLSSPKQTGDLLRAHGLRPQKRLGQNFLCDRNSLERIADAGNLTLDTPVLEIGAGLGALTQTLSERAARVTTIEIDGALIPLLEENLVGYDNVRVIAEDFLRLRRDKLFDEAFGETKGVIVANIPYYITTPIIERLLMHKDRWSRVVLLVQEEFARRAVAKAGADECGAMTHFIQYHTKAEIVGLVPRSVFLPVPEVGSAILALTPIIPGAVIVENEERLLHIVRAAFGQRRKTLLNALLRAPAPFELGFTIDDREKAEELLLKAGIDGTRRGETLTLEEFARIERVYENNPAV
ncbi:MAG: ribosomal RNA small subunit methyltransferase A [Chthonomonadaceae bacterium]|nr:ribosomal RNA small subunit methyltransferase A [Chthonomonadaceae bacterium]